METLIIKLGGSVITNKNELFRPRKEIISRIAGEISRILQEKIRIVLIHGGGSFGHPLAEAYKIGKEMKDSRNLIGIPYTVEAMRILSSLVISELQRKNVPAIPFQPSSFMYKDQTGNLNADLTPLKECLRYNLTPVLWGDVTLEKTSRYSQETK